MTAAAAVPEPEGSRKAAALAFPEGFRWGATTSAYQIEGASDTDGRGPSTWDVFCRQPGSVRFGHTGDRATEHYHRYEQDLDLMVELGLQLYRFSLAWPRVFPAGDGALNGPGLDFYDRLVDGLLARGIEPFATLHHWDLPQALQDRGGWADRSTAAHFAEYALAVHERLGDRVRHWSTLNEPWCQAYLGHATGTHAPGLTDVATAVRVAHHLLLGHGEAVRAMRSARPDAEYSIVLNVEPVTPADPDDPADRDAARRVDGLLDRFWLDAVFHGRYPADVIEDLAPVTDWSFVRNGDLATIATPIDALGVNYYRRQIVQGTPVDGAGEGGADVWPGSGIARTVRTGAPLTDIGWEIDASGLTELLLRLARDYPAVPMYVTENGAAFDDEVAADGQVHDPARVSYLDAHVRALHAAITGGVDVRGYFVWSLVDNFEWAEGYTKRFGLVYVDFARQARIVKDSGWWFRGVIMGHGLPDSPDGPAGARPARPAMMGRAGR